MGEELNAQVSSIIREITVVENIIGLKLEPAKMSLISEGERYRFLR